MPRTRTMLLAGLLVVALVVWVGQLIFLQPPPRIQSKNYWSEVDAEQLYADLIRGFVDVETTGVGGTGVLHWAAAWAHDGQIISILLSNGAKIDSRDLASKRQAIHLAALNPNPGVVRALVEGGADVNDEDSQKLRPLHLAAASNSNPELIRLLVDLGAEIDAKDYYHNTPLHKAAVNQTPQILQQLLTLGANGDAFNYIGHRPLEVAIKENPNLDSIAFLFEHTYQARVHMRDEMKRSWLHLAAVSNANPKVIEYLIEQGDDASALDDAGMSPVHRAAGANANLEVLQLLVERGGDINQASTMDGYTPLHYAAAFNPNQQIVQWLIDAGAQADARTNSGGLSALHLCLLGKNIEQVCAFLAGLKGQALLKDNLDYTALHHALLNDRSPDLIKILLEQGADVHASTQGGLSVQALIERKRLQQALE